MAATCTLNNSEVLAAQLNSFQAQANASSNTSASPNNQDISSSSSNNNTHAHYSNYSNFNMSPQASFAEASSSPSSSSPTSSSCTSMSTYSPNHIGNDDLEHENNSFANFNLNLNNDLTITNGTNVSMKRILQEINSNNNNNNNNKSNDIFFDMLPAASSNANQRAASFSFFESGSSSQTANDSLLKCDQENLKENLSKLVGSFIQNGNHSNQPKNQFL